MSNKNYNKMYNSQQHKEEEIAPEAVEYPVVEVQTAIEGVAEEVVIEEPKEAANKTHAIVVNCAKLNVREEPSPRAVVVGIIDASNEVVISEDESFGNYYKVLTASGIEGYCIKDYLELK